MLITTAGALVTHYNFIIVGAGAAGCILARRLSELCPDASIGLLEAGPDGRVSPFIHSDLPSVFQTWSPTSNWQLKTCPQSGLKNRSVDITQGKVLGGGTSVNAMMYVRGDFAVIDEWHLRSGFNSNWSPSCYQRHFQSIESFHTDQVSPLRGSAGPLSIRETPRPSQSSLAFLDAIAERGYQIADFNGQSQRNTGGLMQLNIDTDGMRCSTAQAFLKVPLPSNLSLELNTEVSSLVMNGNCCDGVYTADGRHITADHTILSAGAFLSPALLMLSGIGDPEILKACNIDCQVANPNVGLNLSDHMRAMVAYQANQDPGTTDFLCEAALFTSSGYRDTPEPDIQINFSAGVDGFIPSDFLDDNVHQQTVIFVPVLARPSSRGSVRPVGPTLKDGLRIDPGYLTNPIDMKTYTAAVEIVRELASTAALAPYCQKELCPGPLNVEDYLRTHAQTIWHPVGTCAMGATPDQSVVDPTFKVFGVDNLSVVDASVLPSLPSGNPQASIFAMASIAADIVQSTSRG
jgi:choline dehydrogenase